MRQELGSQFPAESRPDLGNEAERRVEARVRALDIGLDLGRHPELRERLVELGTHFEDSVDIANIVRSTYPEMQRALGLSAERPERLMRAGLLHDIGKSGPPGERGAFHAAVQKLFVVPEIKFSPFDAGRPKTIAEFMHATSMQDAGELTQTLADNGVDANHEPIISFWRRHAEWTYGILQDEEGDDLDPETIKIAASHHLFEGRNPAELDLEHLPVEAGGAEFLAQCEMVAAIDKYQACRVRGSMSHEDAVASLRRMVEANKSYPEPLKQKFLAAVATLDLARDAVEAVLGK